MKVAWSKLEIALARSCKSIADLRKSNIHPRTLSKIRSDPTYQPTTKTIGKIAKALNVDVRELLEEEQNHG